MQRRRGCQRRGALRFPSTCARGCSAAKALNSKVRCLLRSHKENEAAALEQENVGTIFVRQHALASAMLRGIAEALDSSR
jgi:hypothetical protein